MNFKPRSRYSVCSLHFVENFPDKAIPVAAAQSIGSGQVFLDLYAHKSDELTNAFELKGK